MAKRFIRNRNTWIAYLLLAVYGYFLNILGPITPFLHDELQLSFTVSSLHFSAFAVGILIVGLFGHLVIRRTGRWRALAIGAIGLGLGTSLLVMGRSPFITIGATFLMGCIGSLILAVVPAALSEEHGEMRAVAIAEANVLASLISTAAPFLVGWLAGLVVGWRLALVVGSLLSIVIGLFLFGTPRSEKAPAHAETAQQSLPPQFWLYWIMLVLGVAIEFCMIYWSADYMERELHLPRAIAAQAVSLFLAGMIVGRFASSRVVQRFTVRQVVGASTLLGLFGFLLYWVSPNPLLSLIGLTIAGLGVAGLYPLTLSLAIAASNGNEAQSGARATLASGVAILVLPLVLGRLADLAGLKTAFAVVGVLFAVLLLMILITQRVRAAVPA